MDNTYQKHKKWKAYVENKAAKLIAESTAEATKECTFAPKLNSWSSHGSRPSLMPSGLDRHVEKQRKALEEKTALEAYFQRHASKLPPPPREPPERRQSYTVGHKKGPPIPSTQLSSPKSLFTLTSPKSIPASLPKSNGNGRPTLPPSTRRRLEMRAPIASPADGKSMKRSSVPNLRATVPVSGYSASTPNKSAVSAVCDSEELQPWLTAHSADVQDTTDLDRRIAGEKLLAARERKSLERSLKRSRSKVRAGRATSATPPPPPARPPPRTHASLSPSRRAVRQESPGAGLPPKPPAVPSSRSPTAGVKLKYKGSPLSVWTASLRDGSHSPPTREGSSPVMHKLFAELSQQKAMLASLLEHTQSHDQSPAGRSRAEGYATQLQALQAQMNSLMTSLMPVVTGAPAPPANNAIPVDDTIGVATYTAAMNVHLAQREKRAKAEQQLMDTQELQTGPPAVDVSDLGVEDWPFIGGYVAGWLAVMFPESSDRRDDDVKSGESVGSPTEPVGWGTAWVSVEGDGVLRVYKQGEPKGSFPLVKMVVIDGEDRDMHADRGSRASVASINTTRTGESDHGVDVSAAVDPITLQCGSNIVQLAPPTARDREKWLEKFHLAISAAKARSLAPTGVTVSLSSLTVTGSKVTYPDDVSLEVEGVMAKRAFSPGKRGKWLRRLCKVRMDSLRLEYYDCKCIGEFSLIPTLDPAPTVSLFGSPEDEADGLYMFKVVSSGNGHVDLSSAAQLVTHRREAVFAEAEAPQRNVWLTVITRVIEAFKQHSIDKAFHAQRAGFRPEVSPAFAAAVTQSIVGRRASMASHQSSDHSFVSPLSSDRPSVPQWSSFKTRQSKATMQLIGLDSASGFAPPHGLGFTTAETRLADAQSLASVQVFVQSHADELVAAGKSKLGLSDVDDEPSANVLPRSVWKFALHRVGTGYRDISTVLSPTDGSASQGLGIAELASAFAALDALTDVSEDTGLTADDVVACVDKQRAMLLSLASTSLLESQEALIGGIDE